MQKTNIHFQCVFVCDSVAKQSEFLADSTVDPGTTALPSADFTSSKSLSGVSPTSDAFLRLDGRGHRSGNVDDSSPSPLATTRHADPHTLSIIPIRTIPPSHLFHATPRHGSKPHDPRIADAAAPSPKTRSTTTTTPTDLLIEDRFASLRAHYRAPSHPIILAHGLFGFDELHLLPAPSGIPGIQYWYGITQALAAQGIEVITAAVPPSGSIERRAERLADVIERKAGGRAVNIVA
ncbi:hypothetical protein MRB53_042400 [Persea americana]|nr:hypothetical protein MRB53_042400 [Persea americana]